jgi:hypothetical protein
VVFRNRRRPELPEPDRQMKVDVENVITRLDAVVDRLDIVYDRLLPLVDALTITPTKRERNHGGNPAGKPGLAH